MPLWNDDNMCLKERPRVVKGENIVGLGDYFDRRLAAKNLVAIKIIAHQCIVSHVGRSLDSSLGSAMPSEGGTPSGLCVYKDISSLQ
jgi:hypothetical protein